MKTFWTIIALATLQALAKPVDRRDTPSDDEALIAKLKTDGTRLDQFHDLLTNDQGNLLPDQDLIHATIFDYNKQYPVPGGEGGTVATAFVDNFPLLIDAGISFSIGSLGPCGIFFPHVHPRANEIFTVIEGSVSFGTMLETSMLPTEANVTKAIAPISGKLNNIEATVFPQGSIHYQINDSEKCEKAVVTAALSSEDGGTTAVLQQVASTGDVKVDPMQPVDVGDIEQYYPLLPPALVDASKKCLAKCKK